MSQLSSTSSIPISQPTQSSNGISGDSNTSPAGSPPLILAFLAIGIFASAMISVFGWRRVQNARDPNPWAYRDGFGSLARRSLHGFDPTASNSGGTEKNLGRRPIMWEATVDRSGKVEEADYGFWENTMPLAVLPVHRNGSILTNQIPSSPTADTSLTSSSEPPLIFQSQQTTSPWSSRRWQRFEDITPLSALRRPNGTHGPSEIPLTSTGRQQPNERDQGEGEGAGDEKNAQVVMIIEMPSPTSSRHHRPGLYDYLSKSAVDSIPQTWEEPIDTNHHNRNFQYCIGTHTCQWPPPNTSPTMDSNQERIPQSRTEKQLT